MANDEHKRILDVVQAQYPLMEPRYALLALYYGMGTYQAVAEHLGFHLGAIQKRVAEIERFMDFNKTRNGK